MTAAVRVRAELETAIVAGTASAITAEAHETAKRLLANFPGIARAVVQLHPGVRFALSYAQKVIAIATQP